MRHVGEFEGEKGRQRSRARTTSRSPFVQLRLSVALSARVIIVARMFDITSSDYRRPRGRSLETFCSCAAVIMRDTK